MVLPGPSIKLEPSEVAIPRGGIAFQAPATIKSEPMEYEIPLVPTETLCPLKLDPDSVPEIAPSTPTEPEVLHTQEPEIRLSEEQQAVIEMIQNGKSVFFTGQAGTGKSVLLREIIRVCKDRQTRCGFGEKTLAITASTGLAAVNIGGVTLHSWAGIGLGRESADELMVNFLGKEEWEKRKKEEKDRNERLMSFERSLDLEKGNQEEPQESEDSNESQRHEAAIPQEVSSGAPANIKKKPAEPERGHPGIVKRWKAVRILFIDESK